MCGCIDFLYPYLYILYLEFQIYINLIDPWLNLVGIVHVISLYTELCLQNINSAKYCTENATGIKELEEHHA